jgi:hypothetical protein
MGISKEEIDVRKERLIRILKEEGKYVKYLRFLRRGQAEKAAAMTEEIIERYGQDLQKK